MLIPAPAARPHRARLRRLIRRATPYPYLTPTLILLVVWTYQPLVSRCV